MSDIRTDDLNTGSFDTWAKIEAKRAAEALKTIPVKVDHKAVTRQAIIVELRRKKHDFKTRSEWKAKEAKASGLAQDWELHRHSASSRRQQFHL